MIQTIQRLLTEPPPDHVFELSGEGVAVAMPRDPGQARVEPLGEAAIGASPSSPNVLQPNLVREALTRLAPIPGKRNAAAVVIPDYAVRMAVLDFEDFPASQEDRTALIRFRLRKSVPFHIEEAQVSYSVQLQDAKRVEVLAVAIARPILQEYEGLLKDAGFRVGLVAPSCLAALPLYESQAGLVLIAKLAGTTLSLLLIEQGRVRLVRCLDLSAGEEGAPLQHEEHVMTVLQQTVAFAEDQLGRGVEQLLLCGFGAETEAMGRMAEQELRLPYAVVRSKFGTAGQANSGLFGLIQQYAA